MNNGISEVLPQNQAENNNALMMFENHEVEVFALNDKVLFNPHHVAVCLDIEFKTAQNHISKMSNKQALRVTNKEVSCLTGFRLLSNNGETFLTESGVYKLIFKSRKPKAEKFQDWVFDEVLPSIRKTGSYSIQQPNPPIQDSEYVTTFSNPTVVMMIRKKNIQDSQNWRFVDFDASLMFGVKADNTITMSEYQFTKAMDMIGWELKSTLAEGFNTPTSPAKRIEIQDVFKPDKPDKFKELEESQKMLKIELAAATSQVEEIKALRVAEEAIRTKAQIGDKKVASAMGKAGALSKKNKKLQQENLRLKRLLLEKNIFDSK